MANMSNYLESQLIKHIFRTGTYTKPTVLAIALCKESPTDNSTGATIVEVANRYKYERQVLNPSDTNWSDILSGNGSTHNLSSITFPIPTGTWGTVTSIAILDSATWGAGNVLFWSDFEEAQPVQLGKRFNIDISNLTIQLDN